MQRIALIASVTLLAVIVPTSAVSAQRAQFPSPYQAAPPLVPVNPNLSAAPGYGQGASLGGTIQPFDPYALPGNYGTFGAPTATPPGGIPGQFGAPPTWPGQPPAPLPGAPFPNGANIAPTLPPLGSPYGTPVPPGGPGLQANPYYNGSPYAADGYGQSAASGPPYQRLFQDTGLRATYLYGKDGDDLSLTEVEASTTAFFANFLNIPNGLRVTPGFAFHWTSGPSPPVLSDVPARLYSGYLDFGLEPQFGQRFGAEFTGRVGIYSDFQKFNSKDSIRFLGTAIGIYQSTPNCALKLGVAYIDRVDLHLLPAFGWLWTPNPQTRWDIFFPAPKLSNYWTTVGNRQVWWYLGGEYGGGSWSIKRQGNPMIGELDRIDINDIRIYVGSEFWSLNRVYGFAELGYVFDRKLVYYRVPGDSVGLSSTFMLRAGISW